MGSKSNSLEEGMLDLLFLNIPLTLVGDAAGLLASAAPGRLYIGLHTAGPGEAGDQSTSETAYTGYARVAVARSGAGWSRTGSVVSNVAVVDHGKCTASPGAALTHFSIGAELAGAGRLLYSGDIPGTIVLAVNVIPPLLIGALTATEG